MSRSASKSKLAGTVGSKGKKESVAPDEVQLGSHGNVVGTVTGGVTTAQYCTSYSGQVGFMLN